jgi:hypothetical protein
MILDRESETEAQTRRKEAPMSKILITLITGALTVVPTTAALAASPRGDTYYVVRCADGNEYEAVDAHAVELGGKAHAVALFSQHTRLQCWLVRP